MTEEEYFRKNYPDFYYGDRPLSPYWDFFQEGVEFGERQSEKKIAELEKDNRLLEQRGSDILKELLDKNKKCIELERQIEKMKCCSNCKHSRTEYEHCRTDKHEKWEIKEK